MCQLSCWILDLGSRGENDKRLRPLFAPLMFFRIVFILLDTGVRTIIMFVLPFLNHRRALTPLLSLPLHFGVFFFFAGFTFRSAGLNS